MAHPKGFEPLTARFVAEYSIQLSYGCRIIKLKTNGGERGIRTLETLLTPTRFPIVRLRPTQPSLHGECSILARPSAEQQRLLYQLFRIRQEEN